MENLFLKYMSDKSEFIKSHDDSLFYNKPIITISREYGCPGEQIAQSLGDTLTKKNHINGGEIDWKWLSKEIIEDAAHKLKLTPSLTRELSKQKERGFFENIALFFSDEYYPREGKIQNTIASFIHTTASEGHVVILGRASEIITHNFINSLHIKLYAPLSHRAEITSINEGVSISTARKLCIENDERRESFRNYFRGEKEAMEYFDIVFNCKEMADEEIIEMILILAESRGYV